MGVEVAVALGVVDRVLICVGVSLGRTGKEVAVEEAMTKLGVGINVGVLKITSVIGSLNVVIKATIIVARPLMIATIIVVFGDFGSPGSIIWDIFNTSS